MERPGSYVVKDERGEILARVYHNGEKYQVFRHPACTLGMFFRIISYLEEQGFDLQR